MPSPLFLQVNKAYKDHQVTQLKGYAATCAAIQNSAIEGTLVLEPNEAGEWEVDELTLTRLRNIDGFSIVMNGSGKGRMSISLIGVTQVTISWDTYDT